MSQPQNNFTWTGKTVALDDPFDLRPAVDAIVKAIEAKSGWGNLVVIMGEMHDCAAHVALRQLMMQELRDRSIKFAYGTEIEHNFIEGNAKDFSLSVPKALKSKLQDHDGDYFKKALMNWHIPRAPVSKKNLLKFCIDKKISVRPNDAFSDSAGYLTKSDPIWKRLPKMTMDHLFEAYRDRLKLPISIYEPLGVALRNHAIVRRAADHISQTNNHLYIQDCGLFHVYGRDGHPAMPWGHSLSAVFQKAGFNVVTAFIERDEVNTHFIHRHAHITESDIYISNMNADPFIDKKKQGYLEKAHLAKIFRQSGNQLQICNEWPDPQTTNDTLAQWVSTLEKAHEPA